MRLCIVLFYVWKEILSLQPDLTMLIRRNKYGYNLTCVATGDETLDYAMTWVYGDLHKNLQSVSKYAENNNFIDKFDNNYYISRNGQLVRNSLEFSLPRVLDHRWEAFEEFFTNPEKGITNEAVLGYVTELTVLHFSILVENEALFKFTTNNGTTCVFFSRSYTPNLTNTSTKCNLIYVNKVNSDWYHYTYNKEAVGEFGTNDWFKVYKMNLISPYKTILKIHNYNFLQIPPNKVAKLFYEDIKLPSNKPLCLAFYLFLDYDCKLEIKLCDDDCRRVYASKVWFGRGKWTQEKLIVSDTLMGGNANIIINSKNNSAECSLIGIDDIRWCKLFESRYMEIQSNSPKVSCASLRDMSWKVSKKFEIKENLNNDNARYIGKQNNITCLSIHKGELCEGHIICNAMKCNCSYGYCGKDCVSECSANVDSFSKMYPRYMNISKITATTAQINTSPTRGYISNAIIELGPTPISFMDIPVNGYFLETNLTNLMPFTNYYVKMKFCANGKCTIYMESKEFVTHKCEGISNKELNLLEGSSSIIVNMTDMDGTHCPPEFYLLRVNNCTVKVKKSTILIKDLQPFLKYNLTLSIDDNYKDRIMGHKSLHFESFTKPEPLTEVPKFTSFVVRDTEVIIDFPVLPKSFGPVKYHVLLKAVKNTTCHMYSRRELYTFNPIHITDLHPYTKYNMTIYFENERGEGPYMYTEFFTLASEKITNEESLIAISNSINATFSLPKCDVLQGPLFYNLTSICLEAWCSQSVNHINFQYNESSKLMDFINNLLPFSKHLLEFNISRTFTINRQFVSKTLMIITPPGTPTKVLEPEAKNINGSLYINWRPPYPPTDIILGYIVEINSVRINETANCSSLEGCLVIYGNVKPNVTYSIEIMALNKNVNELGPPVAIKSTILQEVATVQMTNNEIQETEHSKKYKTNDFSNELSKSTSIPFESTILPLFTNITVTLSKNCVVVLQWKHPDATNTNATFLIKVAVNESDAFIEMYYLPASHIFGKYMFTNLSLATTYNINIDVQDSKYSAKETSFQVTTCTSPMPLEVVQKGYAMYLIIVASVLIVVIIIIILSSFMLKSRRKYSVRNKRKDLEDFCLIQRDNLIITQKNEFCPLMRRLVCNNLYTDLLTEEYKEIWDKMNVWYELIFPNQFCRVLEKEEMHLNAHFIQGWRGENTFIAAQCPRGNYSVELFWNTVNDKNIKIIVSLLTKAESELAASKYWSDDVYKNNGKTLEVKCTLSESYTDYVVREFMITKDNQESHVRHFNFFSFPHDDFPSYPNSFMNFLKHIKGIDITSAPILVHCSDGFGRTGVFIMSYNFMRSKECVVNIQKYLEDIRKCRPMLLNNFEQYQFVYYILHQICLNYNSGLSTNTFLGCYTDIIDDKIEEDFNYLTRYDYIYKMFRGKRKMPNEIKATVIPGYENQCNYFAIQTVERRNFYLFWKHVMSNGIKIIIVLQNIDQEHNKFWPSYGNSCTFEDIHIQSRDHYKHDNIILYKLNVLQRKQSSPFGDKEARFGDHLKNTYGTCVIGAAPGVSGKTFNNELKPMHERNFCGPIFMCIYLNNVNEKTITLIYYKQWDSKKYTPACEQDFYSLLKCYYALNNREEDILLCCKDGLIGCGLFICADLILQKIKFEYLFDLIWAAHGLKFVDINFMKHLDQHRFLYALVKYYLEVIENEDSYHEYSVVIKDEKLLEIANAYDKIH